MKIALIFSQVESNNVYCQLLNSAEDVLSFFFTGLSTPENTEKYKKEKKRLVIVKQTLT